MQIILMKSREIFKLYQQALVRRPYLVQAVQTAALMGAGDIVAQTLIEKKAFTDINYMRTAQFSSIGFFIAGPTLRLWYGVLHKYIGSGGKAVAVKKVLVDQALFAPMFLYVCLGAVGALQDKPLNTVKSDLDGYYFDVLKANYFIWPGVQLVNFCYVPLQYQVLLVQFVALFWNTYLSWKINVKKELEE